MLPWQREVGQRLGLHGHHEPAQLLAQVISRNPAQAQRPGQPGHRYQVVGRRPSRRGRRRCEDGSTRPVDQEAPGVQRPDDLPRPVSLEDLHRHPHEQRDRLTHSEGARPQHRTDACRTSRRSRIHGPSLHPLHSPARTVHSQRRVQRSGEGSR